MLDEPLEERSDSGGLVEESAILKQDRSHPVDTKI